MGETGVSTSDTFGVLPAGVNAAVALSYLHRVLAAIETENRSTKALISLTESEAEEDLERVLSARHSGSPLPLDGRFFVVKNNIDVGGVPGTLGSEHFSHRIPEHDADVVQKFREAGAILVGVANMHELAFGATSENAYFGTVQNPWDSTRNAGGSSGGSAVAVALGWVDFSLGTDTGGSVRCPAAIEGVSGLRPTFDEVSAHGVYPLAPSFDTVGLFSRTAVDLELLLDIAVGVEPRHGSVGPTPLRIGIPTGGYFTEGVGSGAAQAVMEMGRVLERSGAATLVDFDLPDAKRSDYVSRMIVRAEAWRVHGDGFEEDSSGFGADVASRLQLAKWIDSAEEGALSNERVELTKKIDDIFENVDVILLPTVPRAPGLLGPVDPLKSTEQNLAFTYLWGLAGLPALSVPCGFDDGMPIGAQLISRRGSDRMLCRLGAHYPELTNWHLRRPSGFGVLHNSSPNE